MRLLPRVYEDGGTARVRTYDEIEAYLQEKHVRYGGRGGLHTHMSWIVTANQQETALTTKQLVQQAVGNTMTTVVDQLRDNLIKLDNLRLRTYERAYTDPIKANVEAFVITSKEVRSIGETVQRITGQNDEDRAKDITLKLKLRESLQRRGLDAQVRILDNEVEVTVGEEEDNTITLEPDEIIDV